MAAKVKVYQALHKVIGEYPALVQERKTKELEGKKRKEKQTKKTIRIKRGELACYSLLDNAMYARSFMVRLRKLTS